MGSKGTLRITVIGDTKPVEQTVKALPGVLTTGLLAAGAAAGAGMIRGFQGAVERADVQGLIQGQLGLSAEQAEQAGEATTELFASGIRDNVGEIGDAVSAVVGSFESLRDGGSDAIERVSTDALNFAQAFEVDVADAVGTASNLMEQGLVPSADRAFDLMIAGSQQITPALRGELLEATNEYSRYFDDLGISAEEMYGLFAQADNQFELDKTGDALKELSIRATDMSEASVDAYDRIGINAEEMAGKILAGGETARGAFQQIVDGLLGIKDPQERANAAIALFGTPLEDLSVTEIPAFLESLSTMEGGLGGVTTASEDLNDALDTPSVKLQAFKNSVSTMLMEWGGRIAEWWTDTAQPALAGFIGWLQEKKPIVEAWWDDLKTKVGEVADEVGAWWEDTGRPAMDAFLAWFEEQWPAIQEKWTNLKQDVENLAAAIKTFWEDEALPFLEAFTAAMEEHWPAIESSFQSLQGIVEDLGVIFGQTRDDVGEDMEGMEVDAVSLGQVFGAQIGIIVDQLARGLRAVEWFTSTTADNFDLLKAVVSGDIAGVVAALDEDFGGALSRMVTAVADRVQDVLDWFAALPFKVATALSTLASDLYGVGRDAVQGFINGLLSVDLAAKARGLAATAWQAMKDRLGISSPSKEFMKLGAWSGQGYTQGLERNLNIPNLDLPKPRRVATATAAPAGVTRGQDGASVTPAMIREALEGMSFVLDADPTGVARIVARSDRTANRRRRATR